MAKNNNLQTLKTTVMQKEFWVGLVTTFIVLLVAFKLIPWNKLQQKITNKTDNVVVTVPTNRMGIPTGESIATDGAMTVADSKVSNAATAPKKKVSSLADTKGGSYTVQNGDNYYTISVKACGNGKFFEYIQQDNNFAALYAGDEVIVNCTE